MRTRSSGGACFGTSLFRSQSSQNDSMIVSTACKTGGRSRKRAVSQPPIQSGAL